MSENEKSTFDYTALWQRAADVLKSGGRAVARGRLDADAFNEISDAIGVLEIRVALAESEETLQRACLTVQRVEREILAQRAALSVLIEDKS